MSLKNNRHSTNWVTFTDMSSATASGEEPVFLPQVKTNVELPFGLPRAGFFVAGHRAGHTQSGDLMGRKVPAGPGDSHRIKRLLGHWQKWLH